MLRFFVLSSSLEEGWSLEIVTINMFVIVYGIIWGRGGWGGGMGGWNFFFVLTLFIFLSSVTFN